MPIEPLRVTAYTLVTALGPGRDATLRAWREGRAGLRPCDLPEIQLATWIGRVEGVEEQPLAADLARFDCRNHRLAELTLAQDGFEQAVRTARARYGADRIGLFVGTSTSGLAHTEQCYRHCLTAQTEGLGADLRFQHTHSNFALAAYCRARLELTGPALVISTACSSSAKVFAVAHRHLAAGFCDAAVVGGVDTLCATTLHGFASLDLLAPEPCRPWSQDRRGLSLGEAGGFALLERPAPAQVGPCLLGYGESSDAYHISSPHPEGAGAAQAMRDALARAGVAATAIDYINLHATGTPANDRAEDRALAQCFSNPPRASGTKGWTGHTLGAAGIVEAIFCLLALDHGLLPGTRNTLTRDPELHQPILTETTPARPGLVLSNSFGFGGTNCCLIFAHR